MVISFKKSDWTPSNLFVFFATLCFVSLIYSPFLLSISMWGFCVVALWESTTKVSDTLPFWSRLKVGFRDMFARLWHKASYRAFTLLFFIVLISGLWSEDFGFWAERTRIRLPFFVLPWAFASAPTLTKKQWEIPLKILLFVLCVTCIGVAVNYYVHEEEILQKIRQGQVIPVPRNHIRFSLTLAFCSLLAFYFASTATLRRDEYLYGFLSVFCFGFTHFLAVRSGILALYIATAYILFYYIFIEKKRILGMGVLLGLLGVLFFAVHYVPSLKNKMDYMRWELQEFSAGRGVGGSDSGRFTSMHVGLALAKDAPLLGVGAGDIDLEAKAKTKALYPRLEAVYKLPHNQYIYILASTGLLGLAASLIAFFAFFREKRHRNARLCVLFACIAHSSFLTEYTIETAIGVAFYLVFTLFLMLMPQEKAL